MFKNVAGSVVFFAFDSATGLPKSGDAANITAYVSKDYGAVTVLADTAAAEMDATNAKGYYVFALAQAESNADVLAFGAKSSTSNVVVVGAPAVVYPVKVDASLIPMVDVEHVTGLTPDAIALNIGVDGVVEANVVQTKGATSAGAAGYVGVDWAHVNAPTSTVALSGTTVGTVSVLSALPTAPTDWLSAAAVSSGAVTKIQTGITVDPDAIAAGVWSAVLVGQGYDDGTAGQLLGDTAPYLKTYVPGTVTAVAGAGVFTVTFAAGQRPDPHNVAGMEVVFTSLDVRPDKASILSAEAAGSTALTVTLAAPLSTLPTANTTTCLVG